MKNRSLKKFCLAMGMLAAFALWTMLIQRIDVQPIGPRDSSVGFAAFNGFFHNLTGVHMTLYVITDWLGLVPVAFGMGFGAIGLAQWIKRKSIKRVDPSILALGGFYIVVMAAYLFFESYVVNYRPVLINNYLEASYPSSTTLLVMCVMPTAAMQMKERIKHPALKRSVVSLIVLFTGFMVVGRLVCGVHWITDIIGAALLSTGLILLYDGVCSLGE